MEKGNNKVIMKQYYTLLKRILSKIKNIVCKPSTSKEKIIEPAMPVKKPEPEEYSTIVGKGYVIPCQIEAYFLALNKYIHDGDKVLDVGFGLGYGLNIMAIKANEVYGVDVDKKVYDYCNETIVGRNPRLVMLDIYNGYDLPFEDNKFDVVTCVDVLEHVRDYHRLVNEMLRVCKNGVFVSTPNRRPEYTNLDGTPKNVWHIREWSKDELNDILVTHGDVEWNFLNGPFEGPFSISENLLDNSLTLTPFIKKTNAK